MLDTAFTIHTESEELARRLAFIVHEAEHSISPIKKVSFEFNVRNDVYEIKKGGRICFTSDDLPNSIFHLQWHMHHEALKDITESIRIHAGCGELNGKRFLIVGDKGAGKTTLMVRLLFEGFRSIADELVLVRDTKVLPFPRRFHIKQYSVKLLPELKDLFDSLPFNQAKDDQKMYSFSPQDAGFDWKIDEGELRAVFYLEPNHGGETRVLECPKYMMAQRIMPMTFLSESEDYMKIGKICKIIDGVDCYVLHIGDLDEAVSKLKEIISAV